jgi:hypothetical protein
VASEKRTNPEASGRGIRMDDDAADEEDGRNDDVVGNSTGYCMVHTHNKKMSFI